MNITVDPPSDGRTAAQSSGRVEVQTGRRKRRPQHQPIQPFAVSADEAGPLCGVSRSTWWSLHSAGKVPRGRKVGGRTVWSVSELRAWVEAGAPARSRWDIMWKEATR